MDRAGVTDKRRQQPRMTVKEFRKQGYLQELNRTFLHPLGLALEVVVEKDGSERFGEVWNYRDDPEGVIYDEGTIDAEKARRIRDEMLHRGDTRMQTLGYQIQPIGNV